MPKGQRSKRRRSSRKQTNRLPWILGGIGIVALIAIPIVLNVVRQSNLPGERFPSQGNTHVRLGAETPAYNSNPPTSGWHTSDLAGWGAYLPDDDVPSDQRLVHNMEDGGVILWYRPGDDREPAEQVAALQEVAGSYRRTVIVPREDMPTTYALTAWQRLQRFDDLDREAMRAFLQAYEGIDHHPGGF